MPDTRSITLQLGSMHAGKTLTLSLFDVADQPVSDAVCTVAEEWGMGRYRATITVADSFTGGTLVIRDQGDDSLLAMFGIDATIASAKTAINALAAQDPGGGDGDIVVDHNYGAADRFRVTVSGMPQDQVVIRAYVQADYDAGSIDSTPPVTRTGADGRWLRPLMLDPQTYLLTAYNPATKQTDTMRGIVIP